MSSLESTVYRIKRMKIRGAKLIAIEGLKELKKIVKKRGFGKEFNRACRLLVNARPTAVVMHNAIEEVKKGKSMETIDRLLYYLDNIDEIANAIA